MTSAAEPVWAPEPLKPSQRSGNACVFCAKVWPRPRVRMGVLGEPIDTATGLFEATAAGVEEDQGAPGTPLYACDDCASDVHAHQV